MKGITSVLISCALAMLLFGYVVELRSEESSSNESLKINSSNHILLLSDKDLVNHKFSILGKVSVHSKAKKGFNQGQADQALKKEAFKKYGSQAHGIFNITYEEKKGILFWRTEITEASADVVTWEDQKKVETPKPIPPEPLPSSEVSEKTPLPELGIKPHAPMDVKVLSSDDLFAMRFLFLGNIAVRNNSEAGFISKEDAIKALKIEAVKKYANNAQGISNIEYQEEMTILHGTKIRAVYADVVTWEPSEESARTVKRESTPSSTDEGIEEPKASSYSTRTARSGQIKVIESQEDKATYKKLGILTVTAPTREGLTKGEIDRELKKTAFGTYGGEAWGIRNIVYEIAQCLKCEGKFKSATGEVVSR